MTPVLSSMRGLYACFRAALARGRRLRDRHPRTAAVLATACACVALWASASGAWLVWTAWRGLPDAVAISRIGDMDQATRVFDADGQPAFTLYTEQRIEVPLSAVSPALVAAIVAVEDQRFYRHHGFDLARIASAALVNVREGRAVQGGSTITQQLARQSFLSADKTFRRKIQELILAARLERQFSKARILELYLNKIYFGGGLYGVEAAARGYFGKPASALSLGEAALIAGLVKSPSTYAPTVSLDRAVARRDLVLRVMRESGAVSESAWRLARTEPVTLVDGLQADDVRAQYFKEQVRQELVERFGPERVYQGGLRVYSTLDLAAQAAAESAVRDGLAVLDRRRAAAARPRRVANQKTVPVAGSVQDRDQPLLQAALIAIDPRSGEVRAMVGGRAFASSSFNRAVQARRQPGSAFKPFVYAAALEAGRTPSSLIRNLNDPIETLQGAWTPEDEHSADQVMSLRTALRTSSNRAAVHLLQDVGVDRAVAYARTLGVGDVPSVPSLALGSGEVTLQSLTAAYAAFANGGMLAQPRLIRRVEDRDGRLLYANEATSTRVMREATAFLMTTLLADVIDHGTGAGARRLGFSLPAAGKTGTTNDYHDAWFVGFTPTLVAGVWVGFDKPQTILPGGFAAEVAVPLWVSFMTPATRKDGPRGFPVPPGITTARICRVSGLLASDGCEHAPVAVEAGNWNEPSLAYTEFFEEGTQPTTTCTLHESRGLLGALAAVFKGGRRSEPSSGPPSPAVTDRARDSESAPDAATGGRAAVVSPARRGFWARLFGRRNGDSK